MHNTPSLPYPSNASRRPSLPIKWLAVGAAGILVLAILIGWLMHPLDVVAGQEYRIEGFNSRTAVVNTPAGTEVAVPSMTLSLHETDGWRRADVWVPLSAAKRDRTLPKGTAVLDTKADGSQLLRWNAATVSSDPKKDEVKHLNRDQFLIPPSQ